MNNGETRRDGTWEQLARRLGGLPEQTLLARYARWLNETLEHPDPLFEEKYRPIVERERPAFAGGPFLSVIVRTQGRRSEMLREALLSLMAQSDEAFEILLIAHGLDREREEALTALLADFPPAFREKLRKIDVGAGCRTEPLNQGFAAAHGAYAAMLDDDDVVFDNWVAAFHEAAREHFGMILHAWVLTQRWQTIETDQGLALRATAAPTGEYCLPFEPLRQLQENYCPLTGLAFPLFFFRELGVCFDESMTTREDWEYLMRLSALAGVTDIPEATGLYRIWLNAEASHTEHAADEWEDNIRRAEEKFNGMPMLLPAGSVKNAGKLSSSSVTSGRIQFKNQLRRRIPTPLWLGAKKVYRSLGGTKWLG